jgi:hypothetical protein
MTTHKSVASCGPRWRRKGTKWTKQEAARGRDFRSLSDCNDFSMKRWLLQEIFGGEVRAVSELENPPQVVLCAVSESVTRLLGTETATNVAPSASQDEILPGGGEYISHSSLRKFQAGLRAECMGSLPTKITWDQADSSTSRIRDRATRGWNSCLA